MKYLKITNVGELDINAFYLIGASTKKNDDSKIGQFGTGLKYAIAYFMRKNIPLKLFIGEQEVIFEVKKEKLRGIDFDVIYCNGLSMNITTEYGYQWEAWEAIREIWCNAKDEKSFHKSIKNETAVVSGKKDWTSFYIGASEEVLEVVNSWGKFFVAEKPIFESDKTAIYANNNGDNLRIYKNGVLIKTSDMPSLFHYDIKDAELNELRQYTSTPSWSIPEHLLKSSKEVIDKYVEFIKTSSKRKDNKYFEDTFDFSFCWSRPSDDILKHLFSGHFYIHPESDMESSGLNVKVSESLFNLMKGAGVPCEKINKSNSYYGSSGHKDNTVIQYRLIELPDFEKKINKVLQDFGISLNYKTATPFGKSFDFIKNGNDGIIFSTELSANEGADLQAVVLLAAAFSGPVGDMEIYKRLIKASLGNPDLIELLLTN